ncbi:unnamed protein product [Effrenium voratum]|nr:unnamed protein product [Effrenium voratum]
MPRPSGSRDFCKKFLCSASVTACMLMLLRTFRMSSPTALGGRELADEEFQPVPPKFAEIDAEPAGPPWALPAPAPQPAPAPASAPTPVANEEVAGESYNGHFLHRRSAKKPGCRGCCNLEDKIVDCLDVEKCAQSGPENGKYALVLSHWGVPSEGMLQSIPSMKAAALAANNADILLIMLQKDADRISPKIQKLLDKWTVKVRVVPWDVPTRSIFNPKHDWCGHQDLIRLHVVGLEGYDAVAYYDADCEFQGDVLPVLRCAASGMFLSTNGGVGESLNIGFIALRPDRRLLDAALFFAQNNNFTVKDGWGHTGWKPCGGYFVGGECGQGFFYSLYYSKSAAAKKALQAADVWDNDVFRPAQIDRCLWNYQTSYQCRPDFDCERVRVHHKPTRERGTDKNECEKLKFRERRKEMARRKRLERKPPTAAELQAAAEGLLLRHSAGLCLRPSTADLREGTVLLLSDCEGGSVENLRLTEVDTEAEDDEDSLGQATIKLGPNCAHPQGDNEELPPSEPRLAFPADCISKKHRFVFSRLKAEGGFLLMHVASRMCVHPFEGREEPRDGTELILHGDCSPNRRALVFKAEKPRSSSIARPELAEAEVSTTPMLKPEGEQCSYTPGSPQSSRPGKPCLPPAKFWPYKGKTSWRIDLGKRILASVTPEVSEDLCEGFYLFGDVTWCNKAFTSPPAAVVGLSYGIEERDIWSELISAKGLPTKLYDCFIPPERSTPISGKAPNGTRKCKGVESQPCYTSKYQSYRICLGAEPMKLEGRRFENLLPHLAEYPDLSVHLKIDTEGAEWPVLEQLMNSPEKAKIRTLDMEVHFGWNNAGNPEHIKKMKQQELLTMQVATMEKLLDEFYCTGSTLEVYREGWKPQDNCAKKDCGEPPVYLPGGFSVEMFAVSYANRALVN